MEDNFICMTTLDGRRPWTEDDLSVRSGLSTCRFLSFNSLKDTFCTFFYDLLLNNLAFDIDSTIYTPLSYNLHIFVIQCPLGCCLISFWCFCLWFWCCLSNIKGWSRVGGGGNILDSQRQTLRKGVENCLVPVFKRGNRTQTVWWILCFFILKAAAHSSFQLLPQLGE